MFQGNRLRSMISVSDISKRGIMLLFTEKERPGMVLVIQ